MAEQTGDYQERVHSDLLDLQAELRGEPREHPVAPAEPEPASVEEVTSPDDVVTIAASGLEISAAPSGTAATERIAALNERLARLERNLAGVTERIDDAHARPRATDETSDADAPWRSFLELQKIVADRLDRR